MKLQQLHSVIAGRPEGPDAESMINVRGYGLRFRELCSRPGMTRERVF
jgi:hypothetical protein